MKKLIFTLSIGCMLTGLAFTQQVTLTNHYMVNPHYYNPAYAGSAGQATAFLGVRKQFVGIKSAPVSEYLSLNSPIMKNMGAGGIISIDQTDILERFYGRLSYSYKIKIGEDHDISLEIGRASCRERV